MEGAGLAAQQPPAVLALGRSSPSFRLRTRSLNALRLRRVFDLFDRDGDGVITVQELALALDRLGLGADPDEIRSAVLYYIPHGSAGLSFDDFEVLHRSIGDALLEGSADSEEGADLAAEEDMREAFRVFDEDGDGLISAEELQSVLAKLDLPEGRSIDRVREMISSVDRNADGLVDFSEFEKMMEGIL